jgi:hypothetical protein
MTIDRAVPRLLSVEAVNRSASGLVVQVTGYSTTRSLRQIEIQLRPRGSAQFSTMSVPLNIEAASIIWFQSAQSQALGGLFSLSVPVTLRRNESTEDLLRHLQAVTVTVSNELGASDPMDLAL